MKRSFTDRLKLRVGDVVFYSGFKLRQFKSKVRVALRPSNLKLSPLEQHMVDRLRTLGYATVHIDELFLADAEAIKTALERAWQGFRSASTTLAEVESYRQSGSTRKEYLVRNFKNGASIPNDHPLILFSLSDRVQRILTGFFGEAPRLSGADFWLTLPVVQDKRTGSQNWHRDHEDQKLAKIFVYLSDVHEENGPTEFIEGSFHGGPNDVISSKRAFVIGGYLNASEIEQRGLLQYRRVLTGPKWTVVFVNTSGIHRGGYGDAERGMANIVFTSQASSYPCRFHLVRG